MIKENKVSPLVSIITPVYNAEKYLRQCIESVLNQTYQNWELLLVDDCSQDSSKNIILEYLVDPRIRFISNQENQGPAVARNIALQQVKGEYITFLDSDDFWEDEKLYNQLNFMLDNNHVMSHGSYHFCNLKGDIIKTVFVDGVVDYECLLKGNQFKIMTVMLHKSLLSELSFENIRHEDFVLFLKILKRGYVSFAMKDFVGSFCRIGDTSVSSNKWKSALWTWNVYRNAMGFGVLKALYYFSFYVINGLKKYR